MSDYDDYEPDFYDDVDADFDHESYMESLAEIHFIDKGFFEKYAAHEKSEEERHLAIFDYMRNADWLPSAKDAIIEDLSTRGEEYLSGRHLELFLRDIGGSFWQKKGQYDQKLEWMDREKKRVEQEKHRNEADLKRDRAIENARLRSEEVYVLHVHSVNERDVQFAWPYLERGKELKFRQESDGAAIYYQNRRLGVLPADVGNGVLKSSEMFGGVLLDADFGKDISYVSRPVPDWEIGEEPKPPIKVTSSVLKMHLLVARLKPGENMSDFIEDIFKESPVERRPVEKEDPYIGRKAKVKYTGNKKSKWVGKTVIILERNADFPSSSIYIVAQVENMKDTRSYNIVNLQLLS